MNAPEGFDAYLWSDNQTSQSVSVTIAGNYAVQVQKNGCWSDASDPVKITDPSQPSKPKITFDNSQELCEGQSIQINAPEGFKYYEWSNGETTQSISIDKSATYSVKVANCSNLFSEISDELILDFKAVAAKPLVSVTDGSKEICTGETVTIAGPEDFNQYLWSDGNQSKEVTVSTESSLFLQVKNDDQCWSEPSETVNVSVKPQPDKPAITYHQDLIICSNEVIELSAPSGYLAYSWSNNLNSKTITTGDPGSYSVKVKNEYCWSESSETIDIKSSEPPEQPSISYDDKNLCVGDEVLISAPSGYKYYEWNTGEMSQQIIVKEKSEIRVKVADCHNIWSELSEPVNITFKEFANKPSINVEGPEEICPGETTVLSGPVGYDHYQWLSSEKTLKINVSNSGPFTLKVRNENQCWSENSDPINIVVKEKPKEPSIYSYNGLIICEEPIQFEASDGFDQYLWSNNSSTRFISTSYPGEYSVKGRKNGCWSDFSKSVKVDSSSKPEKPSISYNREKELCNGEEIIISAPEGYYYYQWSNGENSKNIKISKSDKYSVRVGNCSDIWSEYSEEEALRFKEITKKPTINNLSGKTNLCPGETTLLKGTENFDYYLWSDGSSLQKINVSRTGEYYLQVKDNGKCISPKSNVINIAILTKPAKPTITSNDAFEKCTSESVTLEAPSGYNQYLWSNNLTTSKIETYNAGAYSVKVKDNNCWSDYSAIIYITNKPKANKPILKVSGQEICFGDSTLLEVNDIYNYYKWSNSSDLSEIYIKDTLAYTVQVANCPSEWSKPSDSAKIFVEYPPSDFDVINSDDSLITINNDKFAYQWLLGNQPIIGATDHYYLPIQNGYYSVILTTNLNCLHESDSVLFQPLFRNFMVYSNPTSSGLFKIKVLNDNIKSGSLLVFNFNSRVIIEEYFQSKSDLQQKVFSIKDNRKGAYVIRLITDNYYANQKLIYR